MNQMNNMDMGKLMEMLSKMDKKQLEQGLSRVSQMLSTEDRNKIINELKKKEKWTLKNRSLNNCLCLVP